MFGFLLLQTQRASASASRIFEVLDEKPEISDLPSAVELNRIKGSITFKGVNFSYKNSKDPAERGDNNPQNQIISYLNLHIKAGESVAIVGMTGSGKSTIARLLTRFYDVDSGSISIDGNDIRNIRLNSLRQKIGIVFDEPFLFSTSIGENISYGNPNASDAEIHEAAKKAQAYNFISDLEDGFSTVVGERGYTLSGGQRQRIALARSLLEKPNILILDDATSAIDVGVESLIHDELKSSLRDTTTILIAQRVSTIALADRVVLLQDGAITDEGSHSSLLERNELYASIIAEGTSRTSEEAD
jgi:ATP-binding cassette subfamily B protein